MLSYSRKNDILRLGTMKGAKKMRRSAKKLICALLIVCLAGIIAVVGLNIFVIGISSKYFLTEGEAENFGADCILVLGAGIVDNKEPSLLLADRIDKGISLYNEKASAKLLMSGDHASDEHDEVNIMKARAVKADVSADDVFMDHAGFSTYESMYRARDIFGANKIIIVTQKYHLYRAVFIARSLGLDAYGVAAEEVYYPYELQREVREVAARCKDALFAVIKPLPTYLGEKISLAGSGSITDDKNTAIFCGINIA